MKTLIRSILFASCLFSAGCGTQTQSGGIPVFDLEAAINDRRSFDLGEIAAGVEFIALDDSRKEGLIGEIAGIAATRERFYIRDNGQEVLFKIFDRRGKFVSTLGRYGRGPNEFMGGPVFNTDYDRDILYLIGQTGDMKRLTMAFDGTGRELMRSEEISGLNIAFFDDSFFVMKGSPAPFSFGNDPDFVSSIGTVVPLLEVYSADLKREQVLETVDKGDGAIILMKSAAGQIQSLSVLRGAPSILSNSGSSLLVKEPLGDTLYHYKNGALTAAYVFDPGRYRTPADAFGVNPTGNYMQGIMANSVMEGDNYMFVTTKSYGADGNADLVLDKRNPAGGFSAVGPDGNSGLFFGGIAFTPQFVRDDRLVGYLRALDIVDNADRITDPALASLAATLRENSNPVIAVVELK
jgi:hypothetical protein